jgi:hypothetical protein
MNIGVSVVGNGTSTWQIDYTVDDLTGPYPTSRERDRERREKATAKAQAALDKAEREYAKRAADIEAEREALEKRAGGE